MALTVTTDLSVLTTAETYASPPWYSIGSQTAATEPDFYVKNMVTGCTLGIGGTAGSFIIDSSCTGGDINHGGAIRLKAMNGTVDSINNANTAAQVLDRLLVDHQTAGTLGKAISDIESAGGSLTLEQAAQLADLHDEALGKWVLDEVGDTLTLYKADGVTVLKTFNLTEAAGAVPTYVARVPV